MHRDKLFIIQLVLMVSGLFLTIALIFYFEITSANNRLEDDRYDRGTIMEAFKKVSDVQREAHGESYQIGEVFACRDNSNKFAIMNDDYCDCADGFDEPLSNACSHVLVAKKRFNCGGTEKDKFIYVSRLNDGVCDCVNGADEWLREVSSYIAGTVCMVF